MRRGSRCGCGSDSMQRAAGGSTGSRGAGRGLASGPLMQQTHPTASTRCPLTCRWVLAATQPPGHRKRVLGKGRSFRVTGTAGPAPRAHGTLQRLSPASGAWALSISSRSQGNPRRVCQPRALLIHPTPASERPRVPPSRFSFSHKILHNWSLILSVKQKETLRHTRRLRSDHALGYFLPRHRRDVSFLAFEKHVG